MDVIFDWLRVFPRAILLSATGAGIGIFLWLHCCREMLPVKNKAVIFIALLQNIVGTLAAKAWAILEVGGNLDKAASLRLFGAVFFVPILYYGISKQAKIKLRDAMDMGAVALAIGLFFARFGCLITGCCIGTFIPGTENIRWPLREAELVFYILFILGYSGKVLRRETYGQVYPAFMLLYGGFRFVMEWARVEYTTRFGVFHLAHIWALLSFAIGASIYFELQEKRRSVKGNHD